MRQTACQNFFRIHTVWYHHKPIKPLFKNNNTWHDERPLKMNESSPPPSLADVLKFVMASEKYKESYKRRISAAIGKCARLKQYNQQPLDQIPANLALFDLMWGQGKCETIHAGFKTVGQFKIWRSEFRTGLTCFFGENTQAIDQVVVPNDTWSAIHQTLKDIGVLDVQLIGVEMVARCARTAGIASFDVTYEWLQEQYLLHTTASKRRAFKLGWELIQLHQAEIEVPLPLGMPFTRLSKERGNAKRVPLPPRLKSDLESISICFGAGIAGGHRRKHRKQVKANTTVTYLSGLTYLYSTGVALGHFQSDQNVGLEDMADPEFIERVIETELDGDFPWERLEASTLYGYMSSCKLAFKRAGLDVGEFNTLINDFKAFENIKLMSPRRRVWCREFLQNKQRQVAFFKLPQTCFDQARFVLSKYQSLSKPQKKQAVAWAVAAAAAAILTSVPLRISTLLALDLGSANSTVNVREKGKDVRLDVSGAIVKNKYTYDGIGLTPKPGGNPKEILSWFINEVRPLILKEGIVNHLRNPDLLFCGINDERMRRIWVDATLLAGVDMTPHMVRHAIATIMANEPDADISLIAALLGDTEATVRKNYIFVEQSRKHQRGQEELVRIQKNALGRSVPFLELINLAGER